MDSREIDRLVAEKVMGWVQGEYAKDKWYYKKNGRIEGMAKFINDWNPSTNIADAWELIEKLYKDKGLRMFVGLNFPPLYEARLKDDKGDWIGHGVDAETAPLAICLAALKAVGVEAEVNK